MFLSTFGYSELVQRPFEKMTFFLMDPLIPTMHRLRAKREYFCCSRHVNPQIGTNSVSIRESPYGNFSVSLSISIRGSPYGNGDPLMENIPIRGFLPQSPN